jgi:hypothetical protein
MDGVRDTVCDLQLYRLLRRSVSMDSEEIRSV